MHTATHDETGSLLVVAKPNTTRPVKATCDRRCKFWSHDLDGSFCVHPKAMAYGQGYPWGMSHTSFDIAKVCPPSKDHPLFELDPRHT